MAATTFTCPVCYDPYTNVLRKAVACPYCAHEACTLCVKQHLLVQPQPCCMSCNAGWNREFIDSILTKTWRMGPLRQHRQDMLVDRERSLLPATQARMVADRERAEASSRRHVLTVRLHTAQDFLDRYAGTVAEVASTAQWIRDGRQTQPCSITQHPCVFPQGNGMHGSHHGSLCSVCFASKCRVCERVVARPGSHALCVPGRRFGAQAAQDVVDAAERRVLDGLLQEQQRHEATVAEVLPLLAALGGAGRRGEQEEQQHQRAAFVRACPVGSCRGFLSTAWKCGMCATWVCPQCHEVKGATKDAAHACDPSMLESARLIEAETKPCPSCASRISRVSGCDQMFCTACNKPFSWRTGRAINGPVHNPHFFEWQRREGVQGAAAAANAIAACGDANHINLPTFGYYSLMLRHTSMTEEDMSLYQRVAHMYHVEMDRLTRVLERNQHTYEALREAFLSNRIDEAEWKRKLFVTENDTERAQDMLDVVRMFVSTSCDLMRQLGGGALDAAAASGAGPGAPIALGGQRISKKTFIEQHTQLKSYARDALVKLSARYGTKTPASLADRL
jgi:hypothetical protein